MRSDFAVFILTHGRADKVVTVDTLKRCGYTGKIIFVIDDEDKTSAEYYERYGEDVVMFDKKAIADETDEGDNFDDRRTITHARNASFGIAEKLGYKYWIQLDDDYTNFDYRVYGYSKAVPVRNMDALFDIMIRFYQKIPALSIAMAQGGDFIGCESNEIAVNPRLKRKCMNSFLCSVDRPFKFVGRMNEDVNTYTNLASRGHLFFTIPFFSLTQKQTQSNSGGITEMYLDYGTYCKAFYTVMFSPSCTKVSLMGESAETQRIHHKIRWLNAVPVILREQHKKIV